MDELNSKANYLRKDLLLILVLVFCLVVIIVALAVTDAKTNYLSALAQDLMASVVGE